ncbi:MAG TPA: DUF1489 domain-containing protein [Rhodopila sp.]|uniref:DUF1489 family protein n=1 Tax=Rhodopila sp. TaxID=2480087 RepID=UPI002CBEE355|nr:DUF1489 domain-containing protein [Rhodopila sp.]HVY17703.1 DUF1489 domain-containing protein [Rhodopila sp.]
MLHIIKLSVGVRDIDHLREVQAERLATRGRLFHRTRMTPRRRDEILDGGSIYWVINGSLLARQRILDIVDDTRDDGTPCTALILDPEVVPLAGRPTRPFQGWRYLDPEDAPPDMPDLGAIAGLDRLPAAMRQELRALCLL